MACDYDTFLKWATSHFGSDNIRVKDNGEILTHSPYANYPEPDRGFNLWMNPSGGKKKLENGAFRCWKTDKMGSLVWLLSDLDNMSYEDAEELLCGITSLRRLEREVEAFYSGVPVQEPYVSDETINPTIELPPYTYLIDDLSKSNTFRQKAEEYLADRKIPAEGLHVCTKGEYGNRIIIPYYDQDGRMIYWNARTLSKKEGVVKYMKPEDESVDQTKILYFRDWPDAGMKVYITEGEFDAMSMNIAGMYGAACGGKFLSDEQTEMMRQFVPVVATDNDEDKKYNSGLEALISIGNGLMDSGFEQVYYVRPPKGFKDWNDLLKAKGPDTMRAYIQKFQKPFTTSTENHLRTRSLG